MLKGNRDKKLIFEFAGNDIGFAWYGDWSCLGRRSVLFYETFDVTVVYVIYRVI